MTYLLIALDEKHNLPAMVKGFMIEVPIIVFSISCGFFISCVM